MEVFTVLGLAIFLLLVMVVVSFLLNIAYGRTDDEVFDCGLGYFFVLLILSVVLSLFFTQPENFGYEKIVSNNSVEEVENDR